MPNSFLSEVFLAISKTDYYVFKIKMKKNFVILSIQIAAFCVFAVSAVYGQNISIIALADEYSQAIRKFEKRKTRGNIESVYRKGQALTDSLDPAKRLDELEALSEADYAAVEKKMKGFVVNRNEIVFINPDVVFFKKLSKRLGTKADIAFFNLLGALKPDSVWAAYIEQQTDYSGCTIYGSGKLTALYGKAKLFKKQFPAAYASDVRREINDIKENFIMNTCACGERIGVIKEFQLFIDAFPKDEITPAVKKRLAEIKKNKSPFRFDCHSG